MNAQPKVSVIIPVYNTEKYLRQCLDSVVNQTLRDIEIICVDDGSTDSSLAILREYEARDERVKVLTQQNQHAGVARNNGMAVAKGEYVAFLDADDWLEDNAYETMFAAISASGAEVCVCRFRRFNNVLYTMHSSGKFSQTEATFSKDYQYLCRNQVVPWDKLYKREFLISNGCVFESLICANDRSFYFRVVKAAKKVIFIQDVLVFHRANNPASLVGETRLLHYDCHFRSYETIWWLMSDQPEPVKEMILYIALVDFASFYKKASGDRKKDIADQLRAYLPTMPLHLLKADLSKYNWYSILYDVLPDELRKKQEADMAASRSCAGASLITWFLRKIRGGFRCWKEHGLWYTVKLAFRKVGRKLRGGVQCCREHGLRYTFRYGLEKLHLVKKPEPKPVPVPVQKKRTRQEEYKYCIKLPPEKYAEELKLWYKRKTGEALNLDDPKTFNEKIQWMKLYDSTPIKTRLADKYLVRDWVKEKIGEEYLIPLLGVWDSFDEIDFDQLPNQFVLKANHGSGSNIIVKDKAAFDKADAKKEFDRWMHTNFAFKYGFELHYMNIPPKIIAEQYLENADGLIDYRFYCFNGKPEQVWVDIYSGTPQHLRSVFDMQWRRLPLKCTWTDGGELLETKPKTFEKMKAFAAKLSEGFAFVRVDFFEVDEKLFMGEMTFTPMSGTGKFEPKEWDRKLGDLLTLPPKSPIPERKF